MIEKWTDDIIKGKILYKLSRMHKKVWGHTAFDDLPKGFEGHMRGHVKVCAKELIREGILISKPTSYGLQVSINSQLHDQIMYYIDKYTQAQV